MSVRSRERSRITAAFLKEHKVTRTHGACPWGCGRMIANGGDHLVTHLLTCKGSPRKDGRAKSQASNSGWLHPDV